MSLVEETPSPPDDRRVTAAMALAVLAGVLLLARLWYLQIAMGKELLQASERNRTRALRRIPPRGVIVDADGVVLATVRTRVVLRVSPSAVERDPALLPRTASIAGLSREVLEKEYADNHIDSYQPVVVAVDLSLEAATALEERLYELRGISLGPEPVRAYSVGAAYGHLLGYVGQCSENDLRERSAAGYQTGDICGKTGVEGGPYDQVLRGKDGLRRIEVDAEGRSRGEIATESPIPGAKLQLNIRSKLQVTAFRLLRDQLKRGRTGAVVALDPRNGAVLCLASMPSYDPREFALGIGKREWSALQADKRLPLINRAVGSATAPGSTFKIVTAVAGLATGRINPYETEYCSGIIHLGRWPKRCHRRSGHGSVALHEAIAKSCDIYFYRVGQRLGPERIAQYARLFGFGERTQIDSASGDIAGVVPTPAWKRERGLGPWVGGDTVDYAIGQAMLAATPMQVCAAIGAIANGGTVYAPELVHSVTRYTAHGAAPPEVVAPVVRHRLNLSRDVLNTIRSSMEAVTEQGGTGRLAALPGIRVAGKTGTAQRRRKGEMVDDAWYVGYAPAEDPRIVVCVRIEEGGHGGEVAAPIARAIMGQYLGVTTTQAVTPRTAADD